MSSLHTLNRAVEAAEIRALESQWGPQPLRRVTLDVGDPFLTGQHQRLVQDGRRAEICYIMHRGNPADGLLLHIKTIYPAGAYRLPTGGIHKGEGVMETLAREIGEETGLTVGDGAGHVQIQRMLGVVAYDLVHRQLQRRFSFATYHFLVQMPPDATLNPQDPTEMIGGWQWRPPVELPLIAQTLQTIGQRLPQWGDWGRFRTVSHEFVGEMLRGYGLNGSFCGSEPMTR